MRAASQQPEAEWNIMVYMAADDVLANFAIESVKQLRRKAGKDVVVTVQLDVDGPFARQRLRRFIFDGLIAQDAKINLDVVTTLDPATNMIDPKTVTDFIEWAYQEPRCRARHHCFVFWGHGPELLAESAPAGPQILKTPVPGADGRQYLTPLQLASALRVARIGTREDPKFDIIAFDACSASIAELAAELPRYATFMIASQEDVPDMSFPYDPFLKLVRANADDVRGICKTGVETYVANYQDYVFGPNTDISQVTLASLDLQKFQTVQDAIKDLAQELLTVTAYPELRRMIFQARKASHGFVGGLFVDLYDFCQQLAVQPKQTEAGKLIAASERVISTLSVGKKDDCVVVNDVLDPRQCHGLSLYFPYLSDDDLIIPPQSQAGGPDLSKGDPRLLDKGDPRMLDKVRQQRITETEQFYPELEFARQTGWYRFIQDGWSHILVELLKPEELDVRYSAQQCAVNLLAASKRAKTAAVAQSLSPDLRASGDKETPAKRSEPPEVGSSHVETSGKDKTNSYASA